MHASWRGWLAFAVWLPVSAAAFQPLVTDDTGTQGAGGNQLEFGYARTAEKEPGAKTATVSLPFVYTRGLTDALDLYVGGSYLQYRPPAPDFTQAGAGNPLAGLKWRFYENGASRTSLAFKTEIRLPVSSRAEDRGLGSGKPDASAALVLTRETGFGAIHANLAVGSQSFTLAANRSSHRNTLWRLSVAPVFDLTERWKIAFDAGLVTNPHGAEKARMGYLEVGAIYAPTKDLDLAAGLIRDVDHQGHAVHTVTVGLTWRFR